MSQFDEFAAGWSLDDKKAFADFVRIRAEPLFSSALDTVQAAQKRVRETAEGTTRLMVTWWDAGVHPAQQGSLPQAGESPQWDTYDMLAALGQARWVLNAIETGQQALSDRDRLNALWAVYSRDIPLLSDWLGLGQSLREAATMARQGKAIGCLPWRIGPKRRCTASVCMNAVHCLTARPTSCKTFAQTVPISCNWWPFQPKQLIFLTLDQYRWQHRTCRRLVAGADSMLVAAGAGVGVDSRSQSFTAPSISFQ